LFRLCLLASTRREHMVNDRFAVCRQFHPFEALLGMLKLDRQAKLWCEPAAKHKGWLVLVLVSTDPCLPSARVSRLAVRCPFCKRTCGVCACLGIVRNACARAMLQCGVQCAKAQHVCDACSVCRNSARSVLWHNVCAMSAVRVAMRRAVCCDR